MTGDLPSITILTPSFNQGIYIERTIQSVLRQDYPNLEYFILDGGSTDETLDILKKYDRYINWVSEADGGQSNAINKGIRKTKGDIIGIINSDDTYEKGALVSVGDYFANYQEALWVTGKCRTINDRDVEIRKAVTLYKNIMLRLKSHNVLLVLNYISQPATFLRRNVIDLIGLLDENINYTMDYDYWLRIWKHKEPGFIDRYLANFRLHSHSKSGTTAHLQFDEQLAVAKRYSNSKTLLALHSLHNKLATKIYKWFMDEGLTPE